MDIELVESGNGGDFVTKKNDLSIIFGFGNMPYLAMFGGNKAQDTPSQRQKSEKAYDWWGNSLLFENDKSVQFNSLTERSLDNNPLSSSGRVAIEQAVKRDLVFMKPFAKVGVSVTITGPDRIVIAVRIIRLDNLQQRDFIYIWDATLQELIDRDNVVAGGGGVIVPTAGIFDDSFDFSFE